MASASDTARRNDQAWTSDIVAAPKKDWNARGREEKGKKSAGDENQRQQSRTPESYTLAEFNMIAIVETYSVKL